jgi:hypothetical protein
MQQVQFLFENNFILLYFILFKIYLKLQGDYTFPYNNYNLLSLNAGSLPFVPKRQYEIYVSTVYFNIKYYQKVVINIQNTTQIPIALIK